jgi:transcriptional regulator with GAF, ATPase, and Fis domain
VPCETRRVCSKWQGNGTLFLEEIGELAATLAKLLRALQEREIRRVGAERNVHVNAVSADAMTALMNYSWPGNVRELEHAIERAVIVARGTSVKVRELPPEVSQKTRPRPTDDSLDLRHRNGP